MSDSWTHDYLETNGIKLHYVTQGEGPLMLMLHGFPAFWYSWRYQIPEFARDYKVLTYSTTKLTLWSQNLNSQLPDRSSIQTDIAEEGS